MLHPHATSPPPHTHILILVGRERRMEPHQEEEEVRRKNAAFLFAVQNGDALEVQQLLLNPVFDPNANGNEALISAARMGYTQIVQTLYNAPRVTDAGIGNAIAAAYFAGQKHVLQIFWGSYRELTTDDFYNSVQRGNIGAVVYLLENFRHEIDPSEYYDRAIVAAAAEGYVDIVKILLQYPNVSASTAIMGTIYGNHVAVFEMLLPRIHNLMPQNLYMRAVLFRRVDILKSLLRYASAHPLFSNRLDYRAGMDQATTWHFDDVVDVLRSNLFVQEAMRFPPNFDFDVNPL